MKTPMKRLSIAVVLGGLVVAGCFHSGPGSRFYQSDVSRGTITSVINSTGTVQPVKTLWMGMDASAVKSGTVKKVYVDHNAEVKKGDVLADIDYEPRAEYAKVISTEDGIVIDRKVEVGQTVAGQQLSNMFNVAVDLKKEVYIYASIDEADISSIREAQKHDQPVDFTVDAYSSDIFHGKVHEILLNPVVRENVVTYQVVVSAPNSDLRLLPGMTAKLSFQIAKREDVVKIPSAALRFLPKSQFVRPDDRKILEGTGEETTAKTSETTSDQRSATQRAKDRLAGKLKHVWELDGEFLRAIEVTTGISDNSYTEMVSGDLKSGQQLVTGMK